jgi:tetratricopeptide (TPR) repeat protein
MSAKHQSDRNDSLARLLLGLKDSAHYDDPFVATVTYASESTRIELEQALEKEIVSLGLKVERWFIEPPKKLDIALEINTDPHRQTKVFYVYHVLAGAPDSINSLNYRREYFYKSGTRVIFWLTEEETKQLTLQAPDFWQVPHPKLELRDEPSQIEMIEIGVEEYYWPQLDSSLFMSQNSSELISRQIESLRDLKKIGHPKDYSRARVMYQLAGLYWLSKNYGLATSHVNKGIRIVEGALRGNANVNTNFDYRRSFESALRCGRANIKLRRGYYLSATHDYEHISKTFEDPAGYLGLGHVARMRLRLEEAHEHYKRARTSSDLKMNFEVAWRAELGMGHIHYAKRELEEANKHYEHANRIRPASPLATLGIARVTQRLAQMEYDLGRKNVAQRMSRNAIKILNELEGTPYQKLGRKEIRQIQAGRLFYGQVRA